MDLVMSLTTQTQNYHKELTLNLVMRVKQQQTHKKLKSKNSIIFC